MSMAGGPEVTPVGDTLEVLEDGIVRSLLAGDAARTLGCAVVHGRSRWAELGRELEVRAFPEIDMRSVMAPYDELSIFLYVTDLEARRVGYVQRVVRARSRVDIERTGETGLEVVDDRLRATDQAERATAEEVFGYYGITEPWRCWNIATSLNTGRVAPSRSRPYALLGYKGLFTYTRSVGIEQFFAYVNRQTLRSVARLGIPHDLVLGRELHLQVGGESLDDYVAVHFTTDERTVRAFTVADPARPLTRVVSAIDLPVVVVADEHLPSDLVTAGDDLVIDLTEPAGAASGADAVIDLTGGALGAAAEDRTDTRG